MLGYQLLDAPAEIGLQRFIVLDPMRLHERLNLWIGIPLFAIDLVAANVKIVVRKNSGHLTDQVIEKLVDFLVRGIHSRVEASPLALDGVRSFAAGPLPIP